MGYKLLCSGDEMPLTIKRYLKKRVCLAVVVISERAFATIYQYVKSYKILHVEFIVIVTLLISNEYLATNKKLLGTAYAVYVVK